MSVRAGHTSVAFTLDRCGHLYGDSDVMLCNKLDAMAEDAESIRKIRVGEMVSGVSHPADVVRWWYQRGVVA